MVAPGQTIPTPPSAEMTAAEQTAMRLRKVWQGEDVALLRRADAATVTQEETSDLLNRFNAKYGVYDRYYDATATQTRTDVPLTITPAGATSEQEDYKTVYNNANKKDFDPTKDNPDNLDSMLSALWAKRYGHMTAATREDALRNEKTLVIKGTSEKSERMSMAISTDGSVNSWIAHAEAAEDTQAAPVEEPFKPKSYWYGPKVVSDAVDVTTEALDGHGRTPSEPPKPPVDSYVFAEQQGNQDPDNKITIIERITVTKAGSLASDPRPPEPTFVPIMTKDKLSGPTTKAIIV